MSYVTLDQLTDRYGAGMLTDLTDRGEVASGEIDTDVTDRAIADAAAVIDGYLAGRYSLPLSEVPPLLADIAAAIALWKLHRFAPDEKIAEDYKEAMRQLQQIGTGTIRLPVAGVEPAGTGGTGVRVTDRERPMTGQNLKGFI